MAKYRKKPVVVEAFQWLSSMGEVGGVVRSSGKNVFTYEIKTLEGRHIVSTGDWIITGVKGEKYPCKPDIFEATYELVKMEVSYE